MQFIVDSSPLTFPKNADCLGLADVVGCTEFRGRSGPWRGRKYAARRLTGDDLRAMLEICGGDSAARYHQKCGGRESAHAGIFKCRRRESEKRRCLKFRTKSESR